MRAHAVEMRPLVRALARATSRAAGRPRASLPWLSLLILPVFLVVGTAQALSGSQARPAGAGMTPGVVRGQVYFAPKMSFAVSIEAPNGQHFCGGALLDAQWVVTAAHCVGESHVAQLRVGPQTVGQGGEVRAPEKVLFHEDFDLHDFAAVNDIALIKLAAPVNARPIQLAASNPPQGAEMRYYGWGGKFGATGVPVSPKLLQMDTLVDKSAHCPYASSTDLCLGDPENPTASGCKGDSGGPVVVASQKPGGFALAGVISRAGGDGKICASHTLATNVPLMRDWVEQTIGHELP